MALIYLLFVFLILIIRVLSGYDSRYQKGKYISIKNPVLSVVLLDNESIYTRKKRLKKDKNKMAICGIPFYLGIVITLITNIIFLIIPDISIQPWVIETNKGVILYTNTLNDKISGITVLMLATLIIGYIAISMMHLTKETKPKWTKIFVWIIASLMIIAAAVLAVYFATELISCF